MDDSFDEEKPLRSSSLDDLDDLFPSPNGTMDNSEPSRKLDRHTAYLDRRRTRADQSRSSGLPNFNPRHRYVAAFETHTAPESTGHNGTATVALRKLTTLWPTKHIQ